MPCKPPGIVKMELTCEKMLQTALEPRRSFKVLPTKQPRPTKQK